MGAAFVPIPVNSSGVSVLQDAVLVGRYYRALRAIRPEAFLGFTAKPNIYGSLAAAAAGVPRIVNNVSGLGTVFIKPSRLTSLVSFLYRLAFARSSTIFFQNRDDLEQFVEAGIVPREKADLLPGSGIDLDRFTPVAEPRKPGPFRFLLVARLLWDKGVREYVEAARIVRNHYPDARFQLLGAVGADNRTAVPAGEVERWKAEGVVDHLGESDDVREAMGSADCIVLPSYREGLPRSLLEGSAMGKPLIATDVAGCRDVCVDGETGWLCEVRSAESLAGTMMKMLRASAEERAEMGLRARKHVERNFCESRVIAKYLGALRCDAR